MAEKLEQKNYNNIISLVKSQNELSVFSVIKGIVPGEIYVNRKENPTAVLIQTSECNFVAGDPTDEMFNSFIGQQLDFWDSITPDTKEWYNIISRIHQNRYIREYTRLHYVLKKSDYKNDDVIIPEGYILEQVIPEELRKCKYKNADHVLEWLENWRDDKSFLESGAGTYLRKNNTIVSWSLSDCTCGTCVAIGIQTGEQYRKNGFGKIVAAATIQQCFQKGYKSIDWLCVGCNKGSIAIATGLGFHLSNTYISYAPYAPVENLTDLTEEEWEQWAEYFEQAAKNEPRMLEECLYTYVKANNPLKVKELLAQCDNQERMETEIKRFVLYLHTKGMASNI